MPHKKSYSVRFTNTTTNEISLIYKISSMPYKWTERSQYFSAKWRSLSNHPTQPRIDWNLFECNGKGKYVGNMYQISNPVANWWGEGDEKIYIDNENFPSTFGTGTEDYYGYAYCWYEPFTHAYHNQVRVDGPANFGHSCVSRFHFLDALTFDKSIKFDIELWHHVSTTVSVASTVYWYERPGARDNFPLIKKEQLVIPKLPELKKFNGVIEGEEMKVIKVSGGKISTRLTGENSINQQKVLVDNSLLLPCLIAGWQGTLRSGGRALWWIDSKTEDELELEFISNVEGTNEIFYSGTRGNIFGKFDLFINGEPARKTLNLYAKNIVPIGDISLGKFLVRKGKNRIRIVTKDKNKITDLFVLDYIKIKNRQKHDF